MFERSNSHILLVAAHQPDLELIRRELLTREPGMVLEIARDARAARAYLKSWDEGAPTPVLILIDVSLPGSLDVLQALKDHPRYRVLPVVMLTAPNDQQAIDRCYSLKTNSCVIKPFDHEQLASLVRMLQRYWCELNIPPEG